ncbi:MAG: AAA family ATPase [gamma proteobacterium symbiont of Bathyaustriella thionipta]|nr:AAA family ATPase [gamma proteobacterium symbiont of Bathyaustriella thionipta]MCU7950136.1 AAA family ATPase [gamma proteobacterium symbiont of Bathyaustriella thionipta]MCU7954868.1 AAA family ATPase [gamma proteobacterium symbiont of Bathyaustriella thionipta]MCU7956697.1 AAA family ATPase [gamma proteobacterium symbiont of Bathyaustriella thionipta]MCU7968092.1 AAA family ATPase [gamma proteobacterium symbiont of Bathyaustriella thionipta]
MPVTNTPKDESARVIAISSGKGGVGKSTLAVNLGIALAQAGNKVCLFDADTNLANINILLNVNPLHTLEHFLTNNLSINDIVTKGPGGIDIIAGASGVTEFIQLSKRQQQKLATGLRALEKDYQYLLIDTAAGIDATNIKLILAAPYLLLIITGEPTSLTDAFSLLRVLKQSQFNSPVLVVVNLTKSQRSAQVTFKRFKTAVNKYLRLQRVFLVGYVLADNNIPVSISKQQPVLLGTPGSPASLCINRVCYRLLTAFNKENKKDKTSTPFSDYFSDLTELDEVSEVQGDEEFMPELEHAQTREEQTVADSHSSGDDSTGNSTVITKTDSLQAGFLQASYIARLLGEKR